MSEACRCLGPERVHDEGELPGCIYPADPKDRRIDAEIPRLGPKVLARMNGWGLWTLGDLTKVGGWMEYAIPDGEQRPGRYYLPALLDIRGLGVTKLLLIRQALHRHGLTLVDEEDLDRWQRAAADHMRGGRR